MQKLFSEFNPTTAQQWKEQLTKDLKGVDFNQLIWHTQNGFDVNPFYTADDITNDKAPIFSHSDWDICDHIMVDDEKSANEKALKALQGGASGLIFFIPKKVNTALLLKDISIEHIYTQFFITFDAISIIEDLKPYLGKVNPTDGKLKTVIHLDPLCWLVFNGKWNQSQAQDLAAITNLPHIPVNGTLYQESGANTVNELAITLAHLNEYLNYLSEQQKLSNQTIHALFSIGSDFFNEIAKLRAAKKLIDLLVSQYQVNLPLHIHAQTTQINTSSLDAYNNMLRSTTEAMSAVLGGCNSLNIFPYNFIYEKTNDFSERIARNQQHVLKEESYLNKMADVSAGSYYIETLTDTLAEKAWEQFKEIEKRGGFIACLKSNYIQDLISDNAKSTDEKIKSGEIALVGVNKFQNKNETIKVSQEMPSAPGSEIKAIRPIRFSLAFEKEFATAEKI